MLKTIFKIYSNFSENAFFRIAKQIRISGNFDFFSVFFCVFFCVFFFLLFFFVCVFFFFFFFTLFGMTFLHAHAQYIYIVNTKYQKPSVKALVQVDFPVYAQAKSLFKSKQEK